MSSPDYSSDDTSDRSYDNERHRRACPYQTPQFHDQECSRFFDCPTHTIERAGSDGPASDNEEEEEEEQGENEAAELDDADDTEDDEDDGDAGQEYPEDSSLVEAGPTGRQMDDEPSAQGSNVRGPDDAAERHNVIDLTASPDRRVRIAPVFTGPSHAAQGSSESPVVIDLTEDSPSPSPEAVSRARAEKSKQERALPTIPAPDAGPSSSQQPRPGTVSPSAQRRPATPPSPPPPIRRRTSTNSFGTAPRTSQPQPHTQMQRPVQQTRRPSELVLPRWQPDVEVTICPICRTQFSFLVRKHHCRKCGRVVCNSCSPHRITIPYQYIVQPPGTPRAGVHRYPSSLISGEGGYADFSSLGGGERVRLCNPCVPDPNTNPPQAQGSPNSIRGHGRSQSSVGGESAYASNMAPPAQNRSYFDAYVRNRSATMLPTSSRQVHASRGYEPTQNRILSGTPPTHFPYAGPSSSGSYRAHRHRSALDVGQASGSSSAAAQRRPLPPDPPQLAEEDECPVCHRELPPQNLPNYEALREAHIGICITAHSTYGGTPTGEGSSARPRRTGMFPYFATEKDCVDSAECTICLEEFEILKRQLYHPGEVMLGGAAVRAARALAPRSGSSSSRAVHLNSATPCRRRLLHNSVRRPQEVLATAAKLPDADPIPAKKPRDSVTISDILERRAKAGKLIAGTAAYCDSDMFKAPSVGKPKARRWDHHLTEESLSRKPCMLKQAAKHLKKPGIISLGGGLPCPEYFPIDSLSMKVPVPPHFTEEATKRTGKTVTIGKHDVAEKPDAEYDLAIGLNYGQATGSAQMVRWVTEHTEIVHNPPYADWRACLTVGSTGALEQALRMLCDRNRGDAVLMDEFAFSTALETAEPLGIKVIGVAIDEQGLLPESMDEMLSEWDPKQHNGTRKPHVLYTVPSGQNPTGATMSEQRRRDVYEVCQKHDVFIIEDEPYYFLQMDPYVPGGASQQKAPAPHPESIDEFLSSMIPSLLSMDVDGRVLRMDSFSKVTIPGSRMGWVTASEQIVERYIRHAEVASQGPAGLSQVVLHKLLDEHWGHEGYFRWLMNLRTEYTKRRNVILDACEDFLPKEVVEWCPPAAGMFQWFQVNYSLHPDAGKRSIPEIEEEIFDLCIEKGVLVARGSWFAAEHGKPLKDLFFRATFAAAAPEPMREAIRRFGEAVKTSYRI